MAVCNPCTCYVDSGNRTERPRSICNTLLGYFHPTIGRTLDEVVDVVVASGWKPPRSRLYSGRAEQAEYLRGYFIYLVRDGFLTEKSG